MITRGDLELAARATYEEAWAADPYHVDDVVRAVFGRDVFCWSYATVRELRELRVRLFSTVLKVRGGV